MRLMTWVLLAALLVPAPAVAAEVKLRCVATNGFVRFITFDESAGVVKLGDQSVEATISKNEIIAYRRFDDGGTYSYRIDRSGGGMNVYDLKTGVLDSAYKCEPVTANRF